MQPNYDLSLRPASPCLSDIDLECDENIFSDIESVDYETHEAVRPKNMRDLGPFDIVFELKHQKGRMTEGNMHLSIYFHNLKNDKTFMDAFKYAAKHKKAKYFIEKATEYYAMKLGAKFYCLLNIKGDIRDVKKHDDKAMHLYYKFRSVMRYKDSRLYYSTNMSMAAYHQKLDNNSNAAFTT